MVNLRAAANVLTSGINPNVSAVARISTGYETAPNGKQVPSYAPSVPVIVQMQALTKREIEHLDNLNIQGAEVGAYSNTQLSATDRVTSSGGDMIQAAGQWYLVVAVLEGWVTAGWSRVALRRQSSGPES